MVRAFCVSSALSAPSDMLGEKTARIRDPGATGTGTEEKCFVARCSCRLWTERRKSDVPTTPSAMACMRAAAASQCTVPKRRPGTRVGRAVLRCACRSFALKLVDARQRLGQDPVEVRIPDWTLISAAP
jgi:hypothetical protein